MNMLTLADKDVMMEFLDRSVCGVLNRDYWGMYKPVPQGVSVFLVHAPDCVEYMFTKDDKIDFKRDDLADATEAVCKYGDTGQGGLIFYMNSAMIPIISKHGKHPY